MEHEILWNATPEQRAEYCWRMGIDEEGEEVSHGVCETMNRTLQEQYLGLRNDTLEDWLAEAEALDYWGASIIEVYGLEIIPWLDEMGFLEESEAAGYEV